MTAARRTPRRRTRRATIILWCAAASMLVVAAGIIAFTTAQQAAFSLAENADQAQNSTIGVSPTIWMQLAWAIQGTPVVFLTVGLACAVAPFFLFAIAAQRRTLEADADPVDDVA